MRTTLQIYAIANAEPKTRWTLAARTPPANSSPERWDCVTQRGVVPAMCRMVDAPSPPCNRRSVAYRVDGTAIALRDAGWLASSPDSQWTSIAAEATGRPVCWRLWRRLIFFVGRCRCSRPQSVVLAPGRSNSGSAQDRGRLAQNAEQSQGRDRRRARCSRNGSSHAAGA